MTEVIVEQPVYTGSVNQLHETFTYGSVSSGQELTLSYVIIFKSLNNCSDKTIKANLIFSNIHTYIHTPYVIRIWRLLDRSGPRAHSVKIFVSNSSTSSNCSPKLTVHTIKLDICRPTQQNTHLQLPISQQMTRSEALWPVMDP